MGLGARSIKSEMTGTGGGRWDPREVAKERANRARRDEDRCSTREVEPAPKPKPRLFGFELHGRSYEVRWEPPTVVDGASMRGPLQGGAQVWVYDTTCGGRCLIARALWNGETLVLRPLNTRVFDRGVRACVVDALRIEVQS